MNDTINILEFPSRYINRALRNVKSGDTLKLLAARASLVVLASGFSLLGLVSFVWRSKDRLAMPSGLENQSHYLGAAASVFVGAIFFAAVCAYWRR
jgi:hypothetical protein